jgi:hypothetical protein
MQHYWFGKLRLMLVALAAAFAASTAVAATNVAKPTLKEGVYRVDWNRKVRDLCVDFYTNDDLTARDWQGVMAAQGIVCTLHDVKQSKTKASWIGRCESPSVGKVAKVEYRVVIETFTDGRFAIDTMMSGDQQASIPIRGEPLKGDAAKCTKDTSNFRPWE